jgi:uncharacterized protein YhfF
MADLESFAFGDSPELADELLALVLIGRKTATCWPARDGDKGVVVGKRWIVKDGRDKPRAVLETVELTRRRLGEVDATLAHDEGEGDQSLDYWRRMHTEYFTHGVNFRRTWSFTASGSGWWKCFEGESLIRRYSPSEGRAPFGRPIAPASPRGRRESHPSTNCARGIPCA